MHHHTQLIFIFLVEMGFHHVGQAVLQLPTLGDQPSSASQNAGITGVSLHARPRLVFYPSVYSCQNIYILTNMTIHLFMLGTLGLNNMVHRLRSTSEMLSPMLGVKGKQDRSALDNITASSMLC